MKKIIRVITILTALILLTGCSKKGELRPVSIGNLKFNYDANVWSSKERTEETAPLEFHDKNGNLLVISVSQESTYQNPLAMISYFETMVSTYESFKVFLEPTKIDVNGTTWYEYGYSFNDGTSIVKVYQRYYGKQYVAASISYISTEKKYDSGYEEAFKTMSDVKVTEVSNAENEAKAHEFLVGEWDLAGNGYLVLNDDGTYVWYKDSTKDTNNRHFGTYGCDVQNATMNLKEGDGVYLVLFPESLMVDGVSNEPTTYKSDYIISFDMKGGTGYQMVNIASLKLYTITKSNQ
jgi:hypothetical protein